LNARFERFWISRTAKAYCQTQHKSASVVKISRKNSSLFDKIFAEFDVLIFRGQKRSYIFDQPESEIVRFF